MKKIISKIPLLGDQLKKHFGKSSPVNKKVFTNSSDYWENRYQSGGNSGAGSYNELAEFKASVINEFIDKNKIESVIEFGSGDGNQLFYLKVKKYLGFDVSEKAIQICQNLFANENSKKFKLMSEYQDESAELTMSLDVIYHLVEDETFSTYMDRLFNSTTKFVIIYSSNTDSNHNSADHVKHRKFSDWVEKFRNNFELIQHLPNKYPFNGNGDKSSAADFFIYMKKSI